MHKSGRRQLILDLYLQSDKLNWQPLEETKIAKYETDCTTHQGCEDMHAFWISILSNY